MTLLNEALWNWSSPVWLTAGVLSALYVMFLMRDFTRTCWFACGIIALVIAFVSPLGVLADGYLFSAHMLQHLLLLLIVPLCWVLSLPDTNELPWLNQERFAPLLRTLAKPTVGWVSGLGVMWFWHIPSLCSAATESPFLGAIRSTMFLAAGMAFWWPVYSPVRQTRLPAPVGIVYLFTACLGCTLLGIYITFTPLSVCPAFASPIDRIGILNMLYDKGFTPSADQQLAGLLMWVPPCSLYIAAIISLLRRWYADAPSLSKVSPSTRISRP